MKLFASILAFSVIGFSAYALAEDNVIKVINDDGSVSVINIGPNGGEPVTLESGEAPKEKAKEVAPVKEELKKEAAPVAKPEKKSEQKSEKPQKAPKEKPVKEKPAKPVKEVVPLKPKPVSNPAYKPVIAPGAELTREEAMAVAIESTSMMARGLDAFPRTLDNRKVWVVVFKTDQGERDILVDAETGEIVRVKK